VRGSGVCKMYGEEDVSASCVLPRNAIWGSTHACPVLKLGVHELGAYVKQDMVPAALLVTALTPVSPRAMPPTQLLPPVIILSKTGCLVHHSCS
jgi:hypothetical protein